MENEQQSPSPNVEQETQSQPTRSFSLTKTLLIILLIILLTFSILGINIVIFAGNILQRFIDVVNPIIERALSDLGYATGSAINSSSHVVSGVSKKGIDILHGSLLNAGDLLITASDQGKPSRSLDESVNLAPSTMKPEEPNPDSSTDPIQNPVSSGKNSWCLVGEYHNKRGCIEVADGDKCLSGQVFPSQQLCLNPTLSQNREIIQHQ